jgi:ribonuclease Z
VATERSILIFGSRYKGVTELDIVLLGTGSPLPDPDRAGPATLVRAGGLQLLVDCGRGVLMRLAALGVAPTALDAVFLTHLHSDHVTDFNDVITTRWIMSLADTPLPVVGPPGTTALVDRTIDMLRDDVRYRLAHHEDLTWEPSCHVTELDEGTAFETNAVRVIAAPTDHRPVAPTVGYRFEHDGAAVVLAGDTVPCAGLDRLCAGADVYVQTVLRRSIIENVPMQRFRDILDYHSSTDDALRTAARAGVRKLVYTHCVPPIAAGGEKDLLDEAREHFAGEVLVPRDLDVVTVGNLDADANSR